MSGTVYIVTAVHNYLGHTKQLLKSIGAQSYPHIQTIIVDDGSTDGTREFLSVTYPMVVVIRGSGNLWWTGGVNRGIARALKSASAHDYILTINNDCTFSRHFVADLVRTSQERGNVVVGSIERDQKTKKILTGTVNYDWQRGVWENHRRLTHLTPVMYHTTKGTLFPVHIIRQVGLLDEKHLPHYGSDIEYTHRIAKAGYPLVVDPHCVVSCDAERTGLAPEKKTSGIRHLYALAFSRKSTINLTDHLALIRLTCPPAYKMRNYLRLLGKMVYLVKKAIVK